MRDEDEEDEKERSNAMGFYHQAQSYRAAADVLMKTGKTGATHPEHPIRFLYYHAIELYLKAFLRMHGYTPRELASRKFGHNTLRLTKKVGKLGTSQAVLPPLHRRRSRPLRRVRVLQSWR